MTEGIKGKIINAHNATLGWLDVVGHVLSCGGECFNTIVQIEKPTEINEKLHDSFLQLCNDYDVEIPQTSANTIFPKSLCKRHPRRKELFEYYTANYKRFKRRRWGTYFGRMTSWPFTSNAQQINQLDEIIRILKRRSNVFAAAYTIQICSPEKNFCQRRGAPCLNSIFLQLEKQPSRLNMLAIYRNHDIISKAYGNYIGLGRLMNFLRERTRFSLGTLTCVSSHAYIDSSIPREKLKTLIQSRDS